MKKIKGILLFGVLFLLGIGSSFAWDFKSYGVRYFSNNNNQIQFNINGNTQSNFGGLTYFDNDSFNSITGFLFRKGNYLELSSLSSFVFTGVSFNNPYVSTLKIYADNNNGLGLYYGASNSSSINVLYLLSSLSDSFSKISMTSSIPYFININVPDSCIYSGVINDGGCSLVNSFEIIGDSVTYSDLGVIHDSQIDGVDYKKGLISYSVGNTYSFWVITGDNSLIYPKTVYRTSTGYVSLNGYFISRVDNFNIINNNSDFDILALSVITGSVNDYVWLYSVYTCPYDALDVSYCNYKDGGYLQENFTLTGGLFKFLATGTSCNSSCDGNYFSLIYSSVGNSFTFSKVHSSSNSINSLTSKQYSINLLSDNSINLLSGVISPGGNGNQSTGSMAINTGLFSLCLTSPSFYSLNTIFCDRVFGGRDLTYVQGLISSGAYLQSYIDGSGNLVYVVDITDEPGVLTGGVIWECYGDRCINTELGSWGDVEPWEILHLSGGDMLSSGYYLGFFESINETGYFFKCPYSYNNSRWVAGRSILNAVGRDPFLPINCFIAAYENGRRVKFFDNAFHGYSWGPLMSGDTQNHINLFTFFDVLLSVALIFFLMKFYHLFK